MKVSSLLKLLLSETWLIGGNYDNMLLSDILQLIKDKEITSERTEPYLIGLDGDMRTGLENSQQEDVAVIGLSGPLVRDDGICDEGTDGIARQMKQAFADEQIGAILMPANTPGGTYSSLIPLKDAFAQKNKPIVGLVDDSAESAGYYSLSNADEIYSTDEFGTVGSIGAMAEFVTGDEKLEKEGYKIHRVFPEESSQKNDVMNYARQGDYSLLRDELSKIARHFQSHVQAKRPGISASTLKGKSYFAREAMELGLLDGLMSFDQAVDRARKLAIRNQLQNSI